ncbi:MAG TPA: penicillin-binding transpeptidase domain-containing protein [Jatrophihabitans sp.]
MVNVLPPPTGLPPRPPSAPRPGPSLRHSRRLRGRLLVIAVLIASMMLTLMGRLYWVQVADPNKPVQTAGNLHTGTLVIPAPRGQIVDATGTPLVDNTSVQTITVDRQTLMQLPDHGQAVLARLAQLLGTTAAALGKQITPCSPDVAAPCWTGEPYQPVPVSSNASVQAVLTVGEHSEQFPGVTVQTVTQPKYPWGSLAAHVLGYTGQITADDKKTDPALNDADQIGMSGLEAEYDSVLRGSDGVQDVMLNPQGYAVEQGSLTPAVQGDTLVTSIDLNIQKLAEQSLAQQITDSRAAGKAATSGSVVVMDPNTGRIVAAASYPTYDPQEFVGGISNADYAELTAPSADNPLLSRAIAGQYAPGSTFKLITTSSLVSHNEISLNGAYPCPSQVSIDGRVKTNYDSESFGGDLSVASALGYSCDTFFYVPAANEYYADQTKVDAGKKPNEFLQRTAAQFGVGDAPDIDLPADEQASGSYADRETRLANWQANKADYCAAAKKGYPDVTPVSQRKYLTQLASENCTDGWRYRAGDNADMAIGQGETTMSPLQLAVAYSAMFNSGKIYEPTLGWGVVDGSGKVVQTIKPKVKRTVKVSRNTFDYIANALNFGRGWAVSGAFAYLNSPYASKIGGKTGTAEVEGKQDTSWLVSWGPQGTDKNGHVTAKFVMVGMVEQAGTGATAAGPMLKRIWDGIFGYNADGTKTKPIVANASPIAVLPTIAPSTKTATQ